MSSFHSDSRYPPLGDWVPGQPPNPMRHAPPLPPRPIDLIQEVPSSPDKPPPIPTTPRPSFMDFPSALQYPAKSEVFTLPELVEKHQNLFPLKVIVVKGHYGDRGEESAIATHEVYNIHFIKRSKVFSVKDNTGFEYIVPLNTACKFGLYYEKGTCYFDTVEDVMKTSPLPQVIASQTAYYGGNPKNSVKRLEVLVVRGINKGRLNRKPTLSVYSITKKEEKLLGKDVLGRFTTDPSYTYMYLTDLIKHVPYKFPMDVHLYPEFDGDTGSNYLASERMTITKEFVETCVVTSPLFEEEDGSNSYVELNEQVVDIPLTLPIEVSVLPPEEDGEDDYEQLYEATKTLISGYDPHKTKTYRDTADDYSYTTQTRVFSAVRKGFENEGLNIEMPQAISTSRLPLAKHANEDTTSQRPPTFAEKSLYEDMDAPYDHSSGSYEDFDPSPISPARSPSHQGSADKRLSGIQQAGKPPTSKGYQDFHTPLGYNMLSHSQSFDSTSPSKRHSSYDAPTLPPRRAKANKAPPLPSKEEETCSKVSPLPPVAPRRESLVVSSADGVFLTKRKDQPSPPPPKTLTIQKTLDFLSSKVKSLESAPKQDNTSELRQQLGSLESLVQSLQTTCSSLSVMVDTLKTEVEDLKTQVKELSCIKSETSDSKATTCLQSLSCDQVVKLLEAMGPTLARYREAFSQEFIDGELLSQCTDDILENDLGIKNKLDRLKLMQVIRGTKSVESILQGSYVQFQFNGASKKT